MCNWMERTIPAPALAISPLTRPISNYSSLISILARCIAFDMDGADLGTFDHGVNGRPKNGFDAVPHLTPPIAWILPAPAFNAEDPEPGDLRPRPCAACTVLRQGQSAYFMPCLKACKSGPSASIMMAASRMIARWELDVKSDSDHPVTDIVFDRKGFMYLAQRGHVKNAYDYSKFAEPAKSQVMRYHRESPG